MIKLKNSLGKKRLRWNELVFFLWWFSSLMPNSFLMSPFQKWVNSSAADATYFCCCQLCLWCNQEDALSLFHVLFLFFFVFLSLGCLLVQRLLSFFTPSIVTLFKHFCKILCVWLCHHSVTKYLYIIESYSISVLGFKLD